MPQDLADWLRLLKSKDDAIRAAKENRELAKRQEYDELMGLQEAYTDQFPEWTVLAEILPSGVARITIVDNAAVEREMRRLEKGESDNER